MKRLIMLMACVVLSVCAGSALAEMTYKEAYDQAMAVYYKRDWTGARDALKVAAPLATADKDKAACLLLAGISETYRGKERDLPAARALFEQVLAIPGALPAQSGSARFQIGAAYYNENKLDDSRKILTELAAEEGADPTYRASARSQLAVICSEKDKNYEKALAEYKQVFEIKDAAPASYSAAQLGIGSALLNLKKYDEALAAYEKVSTMKKVPGVHIVTALVQRGHIYRTIKDYPKAREQYAAALLIKEAPSHFPSHIHYYTGICWREEGNKDKARESFMKLLDLPEAAASASLRTNAQKFMAAMDKEPK